MIVFRKGMAAAQALKRQPTAFQRPVFGDCLVRIGRAGRIIPASRGKCGRNVLLIETDQTQKNFFHGRTSKSFSLDGGRLDQDTGLFCQLQIGSG